MMTINNLKKTLEENPQFSIEDDVIISMINYKKHRFEVVGNGQVRIDKENIILKGIINQEEVSYELDTKTYPLLPFVPGLRLELQVGQDIYRLEFKDPYNVMIFINFLKVVSNNY